MSKRGPLIRVGGQRLNRQQILGNTMRADVRPSRPFEGIKLHIGQQQLVSARAGRNAKCPCGSGNKYKKCCGSGGVQ